MKELELVLLPPKEKKEVTEEDIVKFYTELYMILTQNEYQQKSKP